MPPTGNKVKMPMVTLPRWKNGFIVEEQLFWDNAGIHETAWSWKIAGLACNPLLHDYRSAS